MNDLILPPEPQPKRPNSLAKAPVEIVIDRRRRRPLRYGLIAALIGVAGIAVTHFYTPGPSQDAPTKKRAETPAPQQIAVPVLDEASKRRIAALQDEVRDLRTKLDAVEKRQQADEHTGARQASPQASPPARPQASQPASPQAAPADGKARATQAASVAPPAPPKAEAKAARAAPSGSSKVDMTPVQTIPPGPKIVRGYRVRDVYHGAALIESDNGMIGVEPGEVVPGVGRVMAIEQRAGHWVVVTDHGEILGRAPPSRARRFVPPRQFARELDGFMPGPFPPRFITPY